MERETKDGEGGDLACVCECVGVCEVRGEGVQRPWSCESDLTGWGGGRGWGGGSVFLQLHQKSNGGEVRNSNYRHTKLFRLRNEGKISRLVSW